MTHVPTSLQIIAGACVAASIATGCTGHAGNAMPAVGSLQQAAPSTQDGAVSMLKLLRKKVVIGSTVDSKFHQLNPYGLDVAPVAAGKFAAGDLAVCNFNAKSNVQGTGFTIVALHPVPGSKPLLVSSSRTLLGCSSMALGSDDTIWATAFAADDNPVIGSDGKLLTNIKGKPFVRPWGQAFAQPKNGPPAFYESNAGNGAIVRINLGATFTYDVIATGFPVNHGRPGSILAPSGLNYDRRSDTLYVVDGQSNAVVALRKPGTIGRHGIVVSGDGKSFSGVDAALARVVFAGSPLNGPISSALLPNGNLVVGNTLDPNGKNLMVEMTPHGKMLAVRNVDRGAAGSIFGMVATGTGDSDTKIYFNDDNHNEVEALER
jgi:hypothetical protein